MMGVFVIKMWMSFKIQGIRLCLLIYQSMLPGLYTRYSILVQGWFTQRAL